MHFISVVTQVNLDILFFFTVTISSNLKFQFLVAVAVAVVMETHLIAEQQSEGHRFGSFSSIRDFSEFSGPNLRRKSSSLHGVCKKDLPTVH